MWWYHVFFFLLFSTWFQHFKEHAAYWPTGKKETRDPVSQIRMSFYFFILLHIILTFRQRYLLRVVRLSVVVEAYTMMRATTQFSQGITLSGCVNHGRPQGRRISTSLHHRMVSETKTRGHEESMARGEHVTTGDGSGEALVTSLLDIVGTGSDGSADTSLMEEEKDTVWNILESLETIGEGKMPLEDENIFGNYNVSYVSMGKRQYGQPAGGRFRTGLGRFLFRTVGLYQSVLQPDIVVNKVDLKIFGFIPCYVGLRGRLVSVPGLTEEDASKGDMKDTAKVFFDPPVLGLPFGIRARIGPKSSVVLKTTYVDKRVRIGKGSRGSLFVFTRGYDSDAAGMDLVGLEKTTAVGKAILAASIGAMIASGGFICHRYMTVPHIGGIGLFMMLLGAGLGFIFSRGGILSTEDDRPLVPEPAPYSTEG